MIPRLLIIILSLIPHLLQAQDDAFSRIVDVLGKPLQNCESISLNVVVQHCKNPENEKYIKNVLGRRITEKYEIRLIKHSFPLEKEMISDLERYRQILNQENIDAFVQVVIRQQNDSYYAVCQIINARDNFSDIKGVNLGFSPELSLLIGSKPPEKTDDKPGNNLLARFPVSKKTLAISGYRFSPESHDNLLLLTEDEIQLYGSRSGKLALIRRVALPPATPAQYKTRAPVAKILPVLREDKHSILVTCNLWSESFTVSGRNFQSDNKSLLFLSPLQEGERSWLSGKFAPGENSWQEACRITDDQGQTYGLYSFENLKNLIPLSLAGSQFLIHNIYGDLHLWIPDNQEFNKDQASARLEGIKAVGSNPTLTEYLAVAATRDTDAGGDKLVFLDTKAKKLNPLAVTLATSINIKDIAIYNPAMSQGMAVAVLGANSKGDLVVEVYSVPANLGEEFRGNGN